MRRWSAVLLGMLLVVGCARGDQRPLSAHTHPLSDLTPFGELVGDATVVGVGEATHNSREFFAVKHRLFRYLVEHKGFTTFSLEMSWDIGLRLNDYVRHGVGDPRQILREDPTWNTREYLDLVEWMRDHNTDRPNKVQFMGNDVLYPSLTGRPFAAVSEYFQAHEPARLPAFTDLADRLRAVGTTDALRALPLAERVALAEQAASTVDVLSHRADAWTVQHARIIAQTTGMLAFDFEAAERNPTKVGPAMRFRDEAMAANTLWWQRHVGGKVLLSAHNGHIAYESAHPEQYPKLQGAFLRDWLRPRYVAVGLTFGRGSFNAQDAQGRWQRFTVGPPEPGSSEHILDAIHDEDFLLDLRSDGFRTRRPTNDIGTEYPGPWDVSDIALGRSFDAVVHFHHAAAATRLP